MVGFAVHVALENTLKPICEHGELLDANLVEFLHTPLVWPNGMDVDAHTALSWYTLNFLLSQNDLVLGMDASHSFEDLRRVCGNTRHL